MGCATLWYTIHCGIGVSARDLIQGVLNFGGWNQGLTHKKFKGFKILGVFNLFWAYFYAFLGFYYNNGFIWGSLNPEPP